MNQSEVTKRQAQQTARLVSWTLRERGWILLRLTVAEMNYAVRRMAELRRRLP